MDLAMVGQWLGEMRDARTTTIIGLVHVDMQALQRTALPAINKVHRCAARRARPVKEGRAGARGRECRLCALLVSCPFATKRRPRRDVPW